MTQKLEPEVRQFLQSQTCQSDPITSDQDVLLSGVLDSLSIANLLTFIEEQYALVIPLDDVTVENFSTTSAIAGFVAQRLEHK